MKDNKKIPVYLRFKRTELLDDINRIAYVKADTLPAEDEHANHQLMDICEDGNIERVSRIMGLAVSACREILYPLTKDRVTESITQDDTLTQEDIYEIDLYVPDTFSKTTVDLLCRLIHEFIVYWVLVEWMDNARVDDRETHARWKERLEAVKDEIHSKLYSSFHRVRKSQTPF